MNETAAAPGLALSRIRIVLCDTLEPANIGAAARALKTMGLSRLVLVRPQQYPHASANRLAVSAGDVLDRALVCATLGDAVAGCHAVFGVSARQRRIPLRVLDPRAMAPVATALATVAEIAIVFGGEEAGLGNDDLLLCDTLVQIPSDPGCRSLNLAAAVQLVAWELRMAHLAATAPVRPPRQGAPVEAFEELLGALDASLLGAGYYANKNRGLALEKLRRILQRADLDRAEIQMLRGVLRQMQAGTSSDGSSRLAR
jgi:tRNA (cytidine32/uridine32-2'-O)-methyltransferase